MNHENSNPYWRQHALFRGIILFGFSLLLFQLNVTGNIKYYIAPKMVVFSIIAMVILFVLSVMLIIKSCAKSEMDDIACDCGVDHHSSRNSWLKLIFYALFLLPILTGFTFPQKFLDSAVAENRGVQLNFTAALAPTAKVAEKTPNNPQAVNVSLTTDTKGTQKTVVVNSAQPAGASSQSVGQPVQQQTTRSPEDVFKEATFGQSEADAALKLYRQDIIHIQDETYVEDLSAINLYLDQFIGKKMEITGFIYRNDKMKKDETVVARFAVACCTADATVFGLDVKGNAVNNLTKDTWVKVQGTIDKMELEGEMVPMLHVDKIEKVKPAKDPYVY